MLILYKGSPILKMSAGLAADPGLLAGSLQVTYSHKPSSRMPLLSARPATTYPAEEHHCLLAANKLRYSTW